MGRVPHTPQPPLRSAAPLKKGSLLWGGFPMPLFLWDYASHTRTDFSYTRKVGKSVCKGTPLAQPRGGSRHREAVTFPPEEIFKRTPPLENAFGYFYRFIKVTDKAPQLLLRQESAENFSAHTVVGGDNSEPPRILNHFCCHSTAAAVLCGSTRRGLFLLPLLCGSTLDCMGGNR